MADAPVAATPAPAAGAQATDAKTVAPVETKAPAETKAEAAAKKEWKLRAKNREVVVDSEEKLLHYANKAFGAEQAFEEAKRMRAEIEPQERMLRALNGDDIAEQRRALRAIVGSDEKLEALVMQEARERYERHQKLSAMPEDQRRMLSEKEQLQQELEQYREQQRMLQRHQEEQRHQQELNEAQQQLFSIASGVFGEFNFPDETKPIVLRGLVPYIQGALEAGIDIDPKNLAAEYLSDARQQFKSLSDGLEGEALVKWLGPEVVKKLNRYALDQLHGGKKAAAATPSKQAESSDSEDEGKKYIREKFGLSV